MVTRFHSIICKRGEWIKNEEEEEEKQQHSAAKQIMEWLLWCENICVEYEKKEFVYEGNDTANVVFSCSNKPMKKMSHGSNAKILHSLCAALHCRRTQTTIICSKEMHEIFA